MSRRTDSGQRPVTAGQWPALRYCVSAVLVLLLAAALLHGALQEAAGQDDLIVIVEKKKRELKEKEDTLREQEKRLEVLRKDVEERIEHYTKLLSQMEAALKKIEQIKAENLDHMVKAYETMTADEASSRLSAADEQTAAKILMKMKSKKAAAVMAQMDPKRAATLTEAITKIEKKFPSR